jgi:hypothetical protein
VVIIINSGVIPGAAAFDPSLFKYFYLIIPIEALCLVVLVALNRHYLKHKTDRLDEIQRLLRRLEDEGD